MKKTADLLIGTYIMMASYAHAGFNGSQNVRGNHGSATGNSDFDQCINGQGNNGGQCAGNANTGAKPKQKDKGEIMNKSYESSFIKKYSPLYQ